VGTIEVNEMLLKRRAQESFAAITELADTIFREAHIPFRTAHTITSSIVKLALSRGLNATQVTAALVDEAAEAVIGHSLNLQEDVIRDAMDPEHFVKVRSLPGGPAPEEMVRAIQERKVELREKVDLLNAEMNRISVCLEQLDILTRNWSQPQEGDLNPGN
jgi:argininosuccinate lyase